VQHKSRQFAIAIAKSSVNYNLLRTRICRAAGIFTFSMCTSDGNPIPSNEVLQQVLKDAEAKGLSTISVQAV
jgi:hypothetical protein